MFRKFHDIFLYVSRDPFLNMPLSGPQCDYTIIEQCQVVLKWLNAFPVWITLSLDQTNGFSYLEHDSHLREQV